MKRTLIMAATAAAVSMTVLLFSGCEAFLLAVFDDLAERPTNVEATIGEYTDRIEVTWDGVNTEDKDYSVDYYEIERRVWDVDSWTGSLTISDISENYYKDNSVLSETPYQYRVRAVFNNNEPPSDFSAYAEGYAMDAEDLKIYLSKNKDEGEIDAAADSWVEFLAQKGMVYTITTGAAVEVKVYELGNIREEIHSHNVSGESTFTPKNSEIHHIKAGTGGTTISVSYSF